MPQINYYDLKDQELIELIRQGDNEALEFLLIKYKNLVRSVSKEYFIIGADKDDILQEGMIGLYKAVRDYNEIYNSAFGTFAKICIQRNILTAIEKASRQKNAPLNTSEQLGFAITDTRPNPEEFLIDVEATASIEKNIAGALSELELQVLNLYLENYTYEDIALILNNIDVKRVDNALQRARRKIKSLLVDR